ncbi:MAG: type II toxin-antitoxin system HicA family toxin [Deltaproteobacteria bacterium]|nr:type II toxin-antitoxin system HicA family toxin [Deltaproteobacteria bacterium]
MLEADGWRQVRMKGIHRQYRHPVKRGTVTIAGKHNADIPIGTMASVLKQAGLK